MNGASVESNAPEQVADERECGEPIENSPQTSDIDQLIAQVRKPEHLSASGWSMMRFLHPFQDRLTRVLIGSKVASWQLTVTWFLLSLISYGVSAVGLPETFLAGAVILFAAIVIDLCDGEIGRVRAQHMSEEEDLRSFIKGMFLDRMCHTICTPVWPMTVAWGLYTLHQHSAVLLAGIALASYHTACRGLAHLDAYLVVYFRERVRSSGGGNLLGDEATNRNGSSGLWARVGRKIEFWIRNGKRFNFMILVASTADVVIAMTLGMEYAWVLWAGFAIYGTISVVLLTLLLVSRSVGPRLVHQIVSSIVESESSGD